MPLVASQALAVPRVRANLLDAIFLFFFRRRLRARLRPFGAKVASAVVREATGRAEVLVEANRHRLSDSASGSHLRLCATITAAYQVLRSHAQTAEQALAIARDVLRTTGARAPDRAMRLLPKLVRDPFRFTVNVSKKKQADHYGATFHHVIEQDDDEAYRMTVTRCFYHQFLVDHGVAELGPAFCEKDFDWGNAIRPDTHGFAFARPTSLLTTGDPCRFEMRRVRRLPVLGSAPPVTDTAAG